MYLYYDCLWLLGELDLEPYQWAVVTMHKIIQLRIPPSETKSLPYQTLQVCNTTALKSPCPLFNLSAHVELN